MKNEGSHCLFILASGTLCSLTFFLFLIFWLPSCWTTSTWPCRPYQGGHGSKLNLTWVLIITLILFLPIILVSLECQVVPLTGAGADPPMPKCGHTAVTMGQYILCKSIEIVRRDHPMDGCTNLLILAFNPY